MKPQLVVETALHPLQQEERRLRDAAYPKSADQGLSNWFRPELDAVKQAVGDCRGLVTLDAGCGWGQMTPALRNASQIVAVDFSLQGLLHFRQTQSNVRRMQADVTHLPVRTGSFDLAISCQVLPHLPTPDLRLALVDELARALKPGGRLVISTMHYNFRYHGKGIPKEGIEGGSFYHRYAVDEFRSELDRRFNVQAIWGIWTYLPKTWRLFMALGKYNVYWDRLWREKPISLKYGKYLLAICTPLKN
jgi:SAM-dependent methyltransferase